MDVAALVECAKSRTVQHSGATDAVRRDSRLVALQLNQIGQSDISPSLTVHAEVDVRVGHKIDCRAFIR